VINLYSRRIIAIVIDNYSQIKRIK